MSLVKGKWGMDPSNSLEWSFKKTKPEKKNYYKLHEQYVVMSFPSTVSSPALLLA